MCHLRSNPSVPIIRGDANAKNLLGEFLEEQLAPLGSIIKIYENHSKLSTVTVSPIEC
jgi:hypothetical protein